MANILTGYGKPSVLLPGSKGQIYVDKLTGNEYECKGERGFVKVDGDDQDNQFNWILKKPEKPFYEEELITIDILPGLRQLVRVSSEVLTEVLTDFASHVPQDVPEGVDPEELKAELDSMKPINVWVDGSLYRNFYGRNISDGVVGWGNGDVLIFGVYRDNVMFGDLCFPKSGTYVSAGEGHYVSGIGYIDDESPRITWDGQTTKLKKLDEKFIPSRIIGIINNDLSFTADPSFDPSTMSVFDALASGKDLLYKRNAYTNTMKCVSWYESADAISNIGFYDPLNDTKYQLKWEVLSDGTVSITNNTPR